MRVRILPLVGVAVVGLTLAISVLPSASAGSPAVSPAVSMATSGSAHHAATQPSQFLRCYSQIAGNGGGGVVSQNFKRSVRGYNSIAAGDLNLRRPCTVMSIDVFGSYDSGSGPATSENVVFYADNNGVPGKPIAVRPAQGGTDIDGDFLISLGRPVKLQAGRYWMAVQINMDFQDGGVWYWDTNKVQRSYPSVWRNRADGFGTGCVTFTALTTCMPSGVGPDLTFDVRGE